MPFRFKQTETVQAVAQLLRHADGSDDCLRIVKLLYIANRRTIKKAAWPFTGGPVVAMRHGPVLSCMLDMVENAAEPDFLEIQGHQLHLVADPGDDKLCPLIIDILQETWTEYKDKGCWQVAEETREFDEWKRNWRPGVIPPAAIPYKDIFEAVGMSDAYERTVSEEQYHSAVDDFFADTGAASSRQQP